MPAAAANIGGGDPQSLLALPLLSCAHGHAIALRNPLKHFSAFMFYRAGHPQSIRRLLPQPAKLVLRQGTDPDDEQISFRNLCS
jgi:hypothetical protein